MADLKKLAEEIVGLTLLEASELKKILKDEYGIEPAAGAVAALFAVLVVLAIGGVAVVASGHGAPLAPAYDDRPDAVVPADRPLTGADLKAVRFIQQTASATLNVSYYA